jgi:hypothetical protein
MSARTGYRARAAFSPEGHGRRGASTPATPFSQARWWDSIRPREDPECSIPGGGTGSPGNPLQQGAANAAAEPAVLRRAAFPRPSGSPSAMLLAMKKPRSRSRVHGGVHAVTCLNTLTGWQAELAKKDLRRIRSRAGLRLQPDPGRSAWGFDRRRWRPSPPSPGKP